MQQPDYHLTIVADTASVNGFVVLGWVAACISASIAVPQALAVWRHPDPAGGVALGTWWLLLANALAWALWAAGTGAWPAGVPSVINGPLAIYIIYRITTSRRQTPPSTP